MPGQLHPQCDGEVPLCCQQKLHAQGRLCIRTGRNPEDSNLAGVEAMQWVLLYLFIKIGFFSFLGWGETESTWYVSH
jgi:hypothetical protein